MATPRSESYAVAAGAGVYAGVAVPAEPVAPYPAWRVGLPSLQLFSLPGSALYESPDINSYTAPQGRSKGGSYAYSGAALDKALSRLWRPAGGGHQDYAGNEVWMLDLMLASPVWRLRRPPTSDAFVQPNVAFYLDGRPSSTHTYWGPQWIPGREILLVGTNASVWGDGNTGGGMFGFDPVAGDYFPAGYFPGLVGSGSGPCWQGANGDVFGHHASTGEISVWRSATNTRQSLRSGNTPVYETAYCFDSKRNIAIRFRRQGAASGYFDHGQASLPFTAMPIGGPAGAVFEAGSVDTYSITYDNHSDCFWAVQRYSGSKLYKVKLSETAPYTATAEEIDLGASVGSWGDGSTSCYGGFAYCPQLRGLVWNFAYLTSTFFIPTE